MKIKKDDNVIVISGKDRGKTGKIIKAMPREDKVVIAGVNVVKIHERPKKAGAKGQVIDKAMPIDVSNVMIVDPQTNKPTRIGYKVTNQGKVRIAKKSNTSL